MRRPRIAFFDFDKTVIHGDAGPMLGVWLYRRRRRRIQEANRRGVAAAKKTLLWSRVLPFVAWMGVRAGLHRVRAVRRSSVVRSAYKGFRGVPVSVLDDALAQFVEEKVRYRVYPRVVAEMDAVRAAGGRSVVVTTGMQSLVEKCLPFLPDGVEMIGCRLEARRGRLTGRVLSGPLYGADKANIVLAYCRAAGVDPADCVAYTDHYSDHQMLDAVGRGVCINPEPRLRRLAKRRGWEVWDLPDPRGEKQGR